MGLGLRPDAFRALTFSHHPHPGVLGLSIQHPPQGVFFKSVLENFLLFLEGIDLKGESLESWDPAVVSGVREGSPEEGVLG